ncbi:hypothetical protein VPH35_128173 [Triticum aestivum]
MSNRFWKKGNGRTNDLWFLRPADHKAHKYSQQPRTGHRTSDSDCNEGKMSILGLAPETVSTTGGRGVNNSCIARVGPLSFGPAALQFWKLSFPFIPSSGLQ